MVGGEHRFLQTQNFLGFLNGFLLLLEFFVHENLLAKGFQARHVKGAIVLDLYASHILVAHQCPIVFLILRVRVAQIVQGLHNSGMMMFQDPALQVEGL